MTTVAAGPAVVGTSVGYVRAVMSLANYQVMSIPGLPKGFTFSVSDVIWQVRLGLAGRIVEECLLLGRVLSGKGVWEYDKTVRFVTGETSELERPGWVPEQPAWFVAAAKALRSSERAS